MSKKSLVRLLGVNIVATLAFATSMAAEAPRSIDVPAGDLISALTILAKQSDIQLVYRRDQLQGIRTQGVKGAASTQEAVKKLLEGTKLRLSMDATTGAMLIAPAGERRTDADDQADSQDMSLRQISAGLHLAQFDAQLDGERRLSADKAGKSNKDEKSGDVEEMIVEEGRIRPFSNANVDIARTVNDVQPYYVFDSKVIERSAAFNLEDFLKQQLTMNAVAQTNSQLATSASASNVSAINLRGLGTDKTLVLINGRRIQGPGVMNLGEATANLSAQADLNGIPLSAIERIEVLPSSASGIYGGSAIGGVVNVILKTNYVGGEARVNYDNTWSTDAPRRTAAVTYGMSLGKTQAMLTAQWSDAEPMLLQDRRELFEQGLNTVLRNSPSRIYSSTTPFLGALPNITSASESVNGVFIPDPGTLTLKDGRALGSRATHISAGISPATSAADVSNMLFANSGVWNLELPATYQSPTGLFRPSGVTPKSQAFMLSLRRPFNENLDLTLDFSTNQNDSTLFGPGSNVPTSLLVPRASIYNPFNSAVRITYPVATGLMISDVDSTTDTLSLGLRYELPFSWTTQADYTASRNRMTIAYNTFQGAAFTGMVSAGQLNPFVDLLRYPFTFGSEYRTTVRFDIASVSQSLGIRGSGPMMSLPWGSPNLTVGLEHRQAVAPENSVFVIWPLRPADNTYQTTYKREQMTDSLYAEALVPLVKQDWLPMLRSLELQISARTERYTVDTGSAHRTLYLTTGVMQYASPTLNGLPIFSQATYRSMNKTVGLKYQPIPELTFRMSSATAFLPPTPSQLIKNPIVDSFPSRVLDPKNNNLAADVTTISGGNPDLAPQNSKSLNIGVIWQPSWAALEGVRLNAEYYKIEQFDAIGGLSAQSFLDNEAFYSGRVVRDSSGAIRLIDTSLVNLYHRQTEGIDLSLDYQQRTRIGVFSLRATESIIRSLKNQYSLTFPEYDSVGFPAESGAAKYKANLQLSWDYRNWSAGWVTNYIGSYKQWGAEGGPDATTRRQSNPNAALTTTYTAAQGSDTIGAQAYHNASLSYAFGKLAPAQGAISSLAAGWFSDLTVQAGVKNVFNKKPPFDAFYLYYLSPYGDTRLRSYWLSVKKSF